MTQGCLSLELGKICKILNGFAFQSSKYVNSGIRIMRIANVQKGYIEDKSPVFYPQGSESEVKSYLLKKGDVLVSLTGNVGRVGVLGSHLLPAALNQRVACLRVSCDRVDCRYLFHVLNSDKFEMDCIDASNGIAQKNLSTKFIQNYLIPLPPLPEQKRIADILDKADALLEKRKQSITKLDTLLQSVFVDMFGDPVTNSKGWKRVGFECVCTKPAGIKAGPFGSSLKKDCYVTSGYRVYGQEQVIAGDFSIGNYYIDKDKFAEMSAYKVKPNDLLVSLVGSFGRVVIVPNGIEEGIINPRLLRIRPDANIVLPEFLLYWLTQAATQRLLASISHGGTMGVLNAGLLKQLVIAVPPLSEQAAFSVILRHYNAERKAVMAHGDKCNDLFSSLQQRAFKGEL